MKTRYNLAGTSRAFDSLAAAAAVAASSLQNVRAAQERLAGPLFLRPWEPDYFASRFGNARFAVFALPLADGSVCVGNRAPSGKLVGSPTIHRSMPAALAAIRKSHPTAAPFWTRGQYWATVA